MQLWPLSIPGKKSVLTPFKKVKVGNNNYFSNEFNNFSYPVVAKLQRMLGHAIV
jgi:hypothetical protein